MGVVVVMILLTSVVQCIARCRNIVKVTVFRLPSVLCCVYCRFRICYPYSAL